MKTTYTAEFNANNTTDGRYEGYTSKAKAIKAAKNMCKGNVFAGNLGSWHVFDSDNVEVASGSYYKKY
jgi:hypothetical protein